MTNAVQPAAQAAAGADAPKGGKGRGGKGHGGGKRGGGTNPIIEDPFKHGGGGSPP